MQTRTTMWGAGGGCVKNHVELVLRFVFFLSSLCVKPFSFKKIKTIQQKRRRHHFLIRSESTCAKTQTRHRLEHPQPPRLCFFFFVCVLLSRLSDAA